MRLRLEAVLSLFFAIVAIGAVLGAKDWPASTRLFPFLAGIPLLTLSLAQLVMDLKGPREKAEKAMDFEFAKDVEAAVARRRTLNIFAWLFGFTIAIWLIGFHIAIPLTVFLYLKLKGHESWIFSITLTAVAYLFFWGVFDQMLHLPLPEGRLFVAIEKLLG